MGSASATTPPESEPDSGGFVLRGKFCAGAARCAAMRFGRRMIAFPLVRIVIAAGPIVAWLMAANALHVPHLAAGVVVLAWYVAYVRLVERRPVDELDGAGAVGEVATGFAVGAALFAVTVGILVVLGVATVTHGDGWRALAAGLGAAIGAALLEETLLRAIFFRLVEAGLGSWVALAASAALFGLLHAANPGATAISTVAIAFEAGVILAAAFMLTRRLWMAIGLHAAWNFTEGGVFGASVSGGAAHGLLRTTFDGPPLLSGGAFGPEASVVAVLVCLTVGVLLLLRAHARGHFVAAFWARR
jgi:CAAX protease family protein